MHPAPVTGGAHIVGTYEAELQALSRRVAAMGGQAERMVEDATAALVRGDRALAIRIVAEDEALDEAQRTLDEAAVALIARRQPIAEDLREVIAALRIAAELERVGDLAKNVAKRIGATEMGEPPAELERGLAALGEAAWLQLRDVLDAFAMRAVAPLGNMRDRDREIDRAFTALYAELVAGMMQDPKTITASTHLLFCIKNFERIGDHATNIAETVFEMVTGRPMPPERPRDDRAHLLRAEQAS